MAGFNTRKHLKAYVRYDGTGRIVAGSLVLASSKPKNGDWVEIPAYDCCGGGGVNCNSFWINQTINPDNPDNIYAIGSGIDSKCNTFVAINDYWTSPNNPNQNSPGNFLLQKFDNTGNLVWNRVFDFEENGITFSYIELQTIFVDKEDNPICFIICSDGPQKTGIVKFDNDGNYLWSKLFMDDYSTVINNVVFDTSNNIYLSLRTLDVGGIAFASIRKISPEGVLLASKIIDLNYVNTSYINVNSAGEVYLVFKQSGYDYKNYIIKFDSSLNEIWNKSFDPPVANTYIYCVALDKDENIVFQIGNGASSNSDSLWGAYIKMSPAGDIIWTTRINNITDPDYSLGTYQLDSDSDGNIYISSTYISDIPNYSDTYNSLIVAKLSSAGAFEWAYFIQPPSNSEMDSWFWYCSIAGTVKNSSLVLGLYDNIDPFNAQLLKLPLTPLADGTYGPYNIVNISSDWTTSSPEIVLTDGTATYEDGTTATEPITYLQFEGNYTTINTPL